MISQFFLDWCEPNPDQHTTAQDDNPARLHLTSENAADVSSEFLAYKERLHGKNPLTISDATDYQHLSDVLRYRRAVALATPIEKQLLGLVQDWLNKGAPHRLDVCTNALGFTAIKVTSNADQASIETASNIAHIVAEIMRKLIGNGQTLYASFELDASVIDPRAKHHTSTPSTVISEKLPSLRPVRVEAPTDEDDLAGLLLDGYLTGTSKGPSPLSRLAARYAQTVERVLSVQKSLADELVAHSAVISEGNK